MQNYYDYLIKFDIIDFIINYYPILLISSLIDFLIL